MQEHIFLLPPVTFILVLAIITFFSGLISRLAYKRKDIETIPESKKSYACGEDYCDYQIQPDYSQFFPFAFFFTIMHVVTLVIAMVPVETVGVYAIAIVYVIIAVAGLSILLRR